MYSRYPLCFYIAFVVCAYACHGVYGKARGYLTGVGSLLLPCASWGSAPEHSTWWQAPLLAKPLLQVSCVIFWPVLILTLSKWFMLVYICMSNTNTNWKSDGFICKLNCRLELWVGSPTGSVKELGHVHWPYLASFLPCVCQMQKLVHCQRAQNHGGKAWNLYHWTYCVSFLCYFG